MSSRRLDCVEWLAVATRNPNIRVVRLAGSGHILWIDDPVRVVSEIERFVAT